MKIVYLHGLESPQGGPKVDFLEQLGETIAPSMNYKKSGLFAETLRQVKVFKPDLIIGSSMGGYFAKALSSHTGIDALLFNPAIHSRSMEPSGVNYGNKKFKATVILGAKDDVIDPKETWLMLNKEGGNYNVKMEKGMGHRTPENIFKREVLFLT